MAIKLTEEEIAALKSLVDLFDREEQSVRQRQIRLWKKLEMYWAGFTKTWWSDVAHDWRVWNDASIYDDGDDSGYYDKSDINVYRAFLETVIASLSTTVPPVYCLPDDADNTQDVETAQAGTKIGELIYRHIDARLLWVRALWIYCTQGMIAAYNYTDTDEKYGTVDVDEYKAEEQELEVKVCPLCQTELVGPILQAAIQGMENEENEFDPDEDDVEIANAENNNQVLCPQCQQMVDPEIQKEIIVVPKLVGKTKEPKSRQCLDINGGLFVKVPNYARCQEDMPYLEYVYETHFTNVLKRFPDLRDKIAPNSNVGSSSSTSGDDNYGRWGRLSPQYYGDYPTGTPTCRNWWFRPVAFEAIQDDDLRESIKEKFPLGCKAIWVNEQFAEACPESLDDHWSITKNPLSEYVHFDPLGLLLVSIQDLTSELISLTSQTIEHGIPQTFADPSVLDFEAYRNSQALVGGVYPAKPRTGKSMQDGFFMTSTAELGREVMPFGEKINELGQFVSGALPTLFGGDTGPNSRTAAQQSMSKNAALQRLQTTWKMINVLWKDAFGKMIPAYIKNMLDDEHFVTKEFDSYVNVVIRKSQLDGKIGSVEVESTEELPFSIGQVRDQLMQLLNQGNPEIMQAIAHPPNIPLLKKALGMQDFKMPGDEQRQKTLEDILKLVNQAPIQSQQLDPMSGQPMPMEMPSIMPEQMVDDPFIASETVRNWLVGPAGRLAKVDRPEGYKNTLLYLQALMQMQAQLMMQQQAQQDQNKEKANGDGSARPAE